MGSNKQSSFDFEAMWTIIGSILFVAAIPVVLILVLSGSQSGESCDRDCEYYKTHQPDREPAPIDYNGDGTITRDEAEDNPNLSDSYSCTSDCSGHQAGYDWARSNNICDPSYSSGNSQSFNEGVRAWSAQGC